MVGAERREAESARDFHQSHGRPHRDTPHARTSTGVRAQMLEYFAHRAKAVGAAVIECRAGALSGEDTGVGQVICMHELVNIVAAAEHGNICPCADPLEEDLKDAEPSVA